MDKEEFEVNAETWHDAAKEIIHLYNTVITPDFETQVPDEQYEKPWRFSMLMQSMIMFHKGQDMEIKQLKQEIDELYSEIERLKSKN